MSSKLYNVNGINLSNYRFTEQTGFRLFSALCESYEPDGESNPALVGQWQAAWFDFIMSAEGKRFIAESLNVCQDQSDDVFHYFESVNRLDRHFIPIEHNSR